MTQEEFIEILKERGYSYKIEGGRIIIYKENVYLNSLTSIPPDVEFRNEWNVYLSNLTSIPTGLVFKNGGDVYLYDLTGGWFKEWKGNIEGIGSKRLLNVMIKQGIFI
jgi:hypothetical protein